MRQFRSRSFLLDDMKALVSLFWQICLLRRGPEAVPVATGLLGLVVVADLTLSLLLAFSVPDALLTEEQLAATSVTPLAAIASLLVSQATFAALIWFATHIRKCVGRFPATITAYFGCDIIVTLVMIIVVQLTSLLGADIVRALMLVIVIWSLAITGFILQRTLSTTTFVALGIALGMQIVSLVMGAGVTG